MTVKEKNKKVKTPAKKAKSAHSAQKKAKKKSVVSAQSNESKKKPAKSKRRPRSDTVQNAVDVAANSFREIEPPEHIRLLERDWPFFDSIVSELANIDWTDHTIELAALLARAMSDLEKDQYMMRREGNVLHKIKETVCEETGQKLVTRTGSYTNPRKQFIDMNTKNIMAMRRSLGLHARGKEGEGRDMAARRAANKKIEGAVAGDEDDDLIYKPNTTH